MENKKVSELVIGDRVRMFRRNRPPVVGQVTGLDAGTIFVGEARFHRIDGSAQGVQGLSNPYRVG